MVVQQIRYAEKRDTGYDRSQLVYHFMTGTLTKNYAMVKNELLQSGIATMVNRTSWPVTEVWSDTWDIGGKENLLMIKQISTGSAQMITW